VKAAGSPAADTAVHAGLMMRRVFLLLLSWLGYSLIFVFGGAAVLIVFAVVLLGAALLGLVGP
jgi:apolipoprotein N-acyltransferase